jgi:hypothetical protein
MRMCADLERKKKMSKILSTLIAGLFAVSAFAADAPKPATPDTKPAVEAKAPAKTEAKAPAATEAKAAPKHHRHHKAKKAAKSVAATPAAK